MNKITFPTLRNSTVTRWRESCTQVIAIQHRMRHDGVCACWAHRDGTGDGWGRGWKWGAEKKGRMEGNDKVREVTAAKVQSGLLVTICSHPCLPGLSLPLMHILIGTLLPFQTFSQAFLIFPLNDLPLLFYSFSLHAPCPIVSVPVSFPARGKPSAVFAVHPSTPRSHAIFLTPRL